MVDETNILGLDFESAIERIEQAPLASARQMKGSITEATFRQEDDSVRQRSYELIAYGVALARELVEEPALMNEFLRDDHWSKDGHKPNRDKVLRLAMRYLLNAPSTGALYDRACTYTNATQGFFEKGIDARKIPLAIKDGGGVEKIVERRRELRSDERELTSDGIVQPAGKTEREGGSSSDGIRSPNGGESEGGDPKSAAAPAHVSDPALRSRIERSPMPRFNSQKHLLLELSPEQMAKVFRHERPTDLAFIVTAEGEEDEFVTFRLKGIEPC